VTKKESKMPLIGLADEVRAATRWAEARKQQYEKVAGEQGGDLLNKLQKHVSMKVIEKLPIRTNTAYSRSLPKRHQEPEITAIFEVDGIRGALWPLDDEGDNWAIEVTGHHHREGELHFSYEVPASELQNELLAVILELRDEIQM
jgi:hypothetical protein